MEPWFAADECDKSLIVNRCIPRALGLSHSGMPLACSARMTLNRTGALASDLRCLVPQGVSVVDAELDAVTTDYGRVIHKRPLVVVRPRSAEDVAAIIRYASLNGLAMATRASAHSQGGQALGEGILLDVRGLCGFVTVDANGDGGQFAAGAATQWRDVLAATASSGFTPPVLTTNLSTTVGGTHAVGGIGHSSFRFGTQADNCVSFEIVTGTGEVMRCSGEENSELFAHALCALGQLGVITSITHRVRRFARFTRSYQLAYRDLGRLLADADRVVVADRVTFLHARTVAIRTRWVHVLSFTIESNEPISTAGDDPFLHGLGHVNVVERTDIPYQQLLQWMVGDATRPDPAAGNVVRPGIDIILPTSVGAGFIESVLGTIPRWMRDEVLPLVQFLRRATLTRPMFMAPGEDALLLLSLLPTVSRESAPHLLDLFSDISAECVRAGGKHYLAGWIPFDVRGWHEHFGARWPDLQRLLRVHDPAGVFANGLIPRYLDDATLRAEQPSNRVPPLFMAPGFAHGAATC